MNIIINGASRGIGAAISKKFAASGDHQIFVMSRSISKLKDVAFECEKINNKSIIIPVQADITITSELEKSVSFILSKTTTVDILINNAGFSVRKPFHETPEREVEMMMKTNFHGPSQLIRLLLPALRRSGNAHVVNIGSMAGFQGSTKYPELSWYGASKAAIAGLTEALSVEYQDSGVSFNCLALGAVQTEMFSEVFPGLRAPVNADQISDFILFFSFNAHKYLNGMIIPVSLSNP